MREPQGLFVARPKHFFEFLGQANDRNLLQAEAREFRASRIELAFAAINENEIGQGHRAAFGGLASRPAMPNIRGSSISSKRERTLRARSGTHIVNHLLQRSEERRVGKECRSR